MVLAALLWSIAGVVTRHLDSAPSFEVNFWRSTFTALTLVIGLSLVHGPGFLRQLVYSPKVTWISGICWSIMFTAFMVAITLTTVANVLIVMALNPLITALFSRVFLHHRLPTITWLAIVVAGLGIVWMFLFERDATFSLTGSFVSLAIPLAAAVNYTTLQHVGHDKLCKRTPPEEEPERDMLQAVLIGAILSALATLPLAWPFQASNHDLGLLSLLGIFQLAIPCLLVVWVSRELSAPEISLLALLEVIFGVAWAWMWAGEHLSANAMLGGSLVLGALITNEVARIVSRKKLQLIT